MSHFISFDWSRMASDHIYAYKQRNDCYRPQAVIRADQEDGEFCPAQSLGVVFRILRNRVSEIRQMVCECGRMTYRLTISSDTVYKNLVAEIVFENGEMLVVSQERSNKHFEVSVFSKYRDSGEAPSGPLMIDADEFAAALAEAKQKLASFGWR